MIQKVPQPSNIWLNTAIKCILLIELALSSHTGPRGQIQAISLGGKDLYLLNCLASSWIFFFVVVVLFLFFRDSLESWSSPGILSSFQLFE